jgi:hypothetical protein
LLLRDEDGLLRDCNRWRIQYLCRLSVKNLRDGLISSLEDCRCSSTENVCCLLLLYFRWELISRLLYLQLSRASENVIIYGLKVLGNTGCGCHYFSRLSNYLGRLSKSWSGLRYIAVIFFIFIVVVWLGCFVFVHYS